MAGKKQRVEKAFQPKGEPKPGRKTSRPRVEEPDELSSAHENEAFRKAVHKNQNNRGGRV